MLVDHLNELGARIYQLLKELGSPHEVYMLWCQKIIQNKDLGWMQGLKRKMKENKMGERVLGGFFFIQDDVRKPP